MNELALDRRGALAGGALLAVGAVIAAAPAGAAVPASGSSGYAPQPVPLPFDPKAIAGLSEKLLTSHHDNNYAGAVKRLGAITAQFAGLDPATAPGYVVNGLKREELLAWNSMILHEIYFSAIGAPNRPGRALASAIERDFGSEARWRAEFTGMGKALGGGSGWVMLTHSRRDNRLVNQWAADHTMALANSTPVLVMDMYEHAYAMDYGAKAGAYVDAFMATVNWTAPDRRFAQATAG